MHRPRVEGRESAGCTSRRGPGRANVLLSGVVLAAVLGLLASDVEAARWKRETVVVRDYTAGQRWGPIIAIQVDALNAALPAGAPRFVYRDAGERPCEQIPRTGKAISVCSAQRLSRPAAASTTRRGETIREALIMLRQDQLRLGHNRVCHELMHAATAIPDDYHSEPQSCVRGTLDTFGSWDIAVLANEYGRGRR
jgi:hypothetical protein